MVKFADRVKVAIAQNSGSWPSTGTVYLGSAAAGFQSVPTSLDGETIRYVIEHGTDWEIGSGTFNNSAQTVSRSLASSSTGSLLDIDGAADFFISPSAADLQTQLDSTNYSVTNYTASSGSNTFDASSSPALPAYQAGKLAVYVNGVLRPASEYTATNGTSVVMTLAANDEVSIVNHGAASSGSSVTTVTNVSGASDSLTAISSPDVGDIVFVTSTNGLFIRKSNGWFKIADVTNLQPTGLTGVSDSALAIDGTATTITLAATDPEGLALTFSAAAKTGSSTTFSTALTDGNTVNALNGSTVIATVAQASNVFTIDPNTASNSGTVDITFSVTDGINTALTDDGQFTLTFVTIVADSNYTTLLATATSTGGNSTIEDSSTANSGSGHSITVNGDAYAGTFSPYRSGGYSTQFVRSSSERFELSGLSAIGSGDFSIEFWIYSTSDDWMVLCERSGSSNNGFELYKNGNSQTLRMRIGNTNYDTLSTGTVISKNEWHFVQIVRESNTIKIYIDDNDQSLDPSTSNSTNLSVTSDFLIGGRSSYYVDGYIRDFRISTSARSKAVPSEPLTADSDTLFITCHKPYIIYETPSATGNISVDGSPTLEPFSPYDYNEYAVADNGGSVYFEGSDDWLQTSTGKIPTSGSFTVSAWAYSTRSNSSTKGAIFGQGIGGQSGRAALFISSDTFEFHCESGDTDSGVTALRNVWYFLELQVTSSTAKLFINGVEEASKSLSSYSAGNYDLYIGDLGAGFNATFDYTGYISDLLVQSGTPSGSSTVPTAPRSSSGASLHIKGTDASIIDKSQGANLKLVGNTTGSTTTKFTGAKSMYFDGSEDYLRTPAINLTGNFTIEFFVRLDAINTDVGIFSFGNLNSANTILELYNDTSGQFRLYSSTGGQIGNVSAAATVDQWNHIAVTRNGNIFKAYKEGVEFASDSTARTINNVLTIGGYVNTGYLMKGYIQDFRIRENLVYTLDSSGNFTPPSAPLEG